MANLAKLDFIALDISGDNYLSWALDAELHLSANGLKDTIEIGKAPTVEQNAKAIIFLRHHIHEDLKSEYLTVKNPLTLWNNLKDRFDHQKLVCLPSARYDWINLRLQDFKSVTEYNSTFKISSRLILCGDKITDVEMIEKTLSTFHPNTMILTQQYRERKYQKYSELLSLLLVAEKNNELLLKNHHTRPTGSAQLPEVHNTSFQKNERGKGHRGGQGYGRNHGRGNFRGRFRNQYNFGHLKWQRDGYNNSGHQKWRNETSNKRKAPQERDTRDVCYRCGAEGHWARTRLTPKHFVDLYESSKRPKGGMVETNFANIPTGNNEALNVTKMGANLYYGLDD